MDEKIDVRRAHGSVAICSVDQKRFLADWPSVRYEKRWAIRVGDAGATVEELDFGFYATKPVPYDALGDKPVHSIVEVSLEFTGEIEDTDQMLSAFFTASLVKGHSQVFLVGVRVVTESN